MDWKKLMNRALKVGLLVGGATWATAYIVNTFKVPTITLTAAVVDVRQQIVSQGSAPAFGNYLLDLLGGAIPDWNGFISLALGSIGVVFLGFLIMGFLDKMLARLHKNDPFKQTVLSLTLGGIAAALILGGWTGIGFWTTAAALLVYYTFVTVLLWGSFKFKVIENFAR